MGVVDAAPPGSLEARAWVLIDLELNHATSSSSEAKLKRVGPSWVRALNPLSCCQTPSESTAAKRLLDYAKVYCLVGKRKSFIFGQTQKHPTMAGSFYTTPTS